MSIGGSKSSGKTTSTSNSSTQGEGYDYGTGMWSGQAPYLGDLYNNAQTRFWQTAPGGQDNLNRSNWADTQGMEALQRGQSQLGMSQQALAGGMAQAGATNNFSQAALNQLSRSNGAMQGSANLLDQSAAGLRDIMNNNGVDPSMAAYAQRMGQAFNEQLMPGLRGDAAQAGGMGGSRAGIAAALGADRSMQAMSDFSANVYGGQQDRRLAATQGLGNLGQLYQGLGDLSNQTAGQYGALGQLNNQTAGVYQGLGDLSNSISGLQGNLAQGWQQSATNNLAAGDFARSMPWYNLNQYAGLLGAPVSLDQGGYNWNNSLTTSSSSGKNSSIGGSFGLK
jgi:hypothetical protein